MYPYPHIYHVTAQGAQLGPVIVSGSGLTDLETTPPPEFGGPAGYWSPETLLCAAMADCFILTFRGIARAARFRWVTLECNVRGTLQRSDGVSQFTQYATHAKLTVHSPADAEQARLLLEQTESSCLVSNSVRGTRILELQIIVQSEAQASPPARVQANATAP